MAARRRRGRRSGGCAAAAPVFRPASGASPGPASRSPARRRRLPDSRVLASLALPVRPCVRVRAECVRACARESLCESVRGGWSERGEGRWVMVWVRFKVLN
jgi:hypothetical protein